MNCYVVNASDDDLKPVARVVDPQSGRGMEVKSTEPGVQFYTTNYDRDIKGAAGVVFNRRGAFCLETQAYPNAVNQESFPSAILKPGQVYNHKTVHRFFTE